MTRYVLTGGSGLIGQSLTRSLLDRGHHVVVVGRSAASLSPLQDASGRLSTEQWDARTTRGGWARCLEGAEAVVNLAGKSIDCRPTPTNRRLLLESRIDSVEAIHLGLAECSNPPKVWLQASAVGYYGNRGATLCEESLASGTDFLATLCTQWEEAFGRVRYATTRQVCCRIGFVLAAQGGALGTLAQLTRWFAGGAAGTGEQYISWIHIQDLVSILQHCLGTSNATGAFNATAPTPQTNAHFMQQLRSVLGRPWSPPVPGPLLRLGAMALGTNANLALGGQRAIPKRLLEAGFEFAHPQLKGALEHLLA